MSSVEFTSVTPRKPLHTIDQLFAAELVPLSFQVAGNIGLYRTVGDGGGQGAGLVARLQDIPKEMYCTLLLVERKSDLVLFESTLCHTTSEGWSVPNKGIVTGHLQFTGISWSNEYSAARAI